MLSRAVRILAALADQPLTKSRLKDLVLQGPAEQYNWDEWQPALGLLRHFGLVEVRRPSSPDDPTYALAPATTAVRDEPSLQAALLAAAKAREGALSSLQNRILTALLANAGRATCDELRAALNCRPGRGVEQVFQAIADLVGDGLVAELYEPPSETARVRLTNRGWMAALEQAQS